MIFITNLAKFGIKSVGKRIIFWGIIALIILYIIANPDTSKIIPDAILVILSIFLIIALLIIIVSIDTIFNVIGNWSKYSSSKIEDNQKPTLYCPSCKQIIYDFPEGINQTNCQNCGYVIRRY